MSRLRLEDFKDIQRLVLQSLPLYRAARYNLMRIEGDEEKEAKSEINRLLKFVASTDGDNKKEDKDSPFRICIAFTWKGLQRLGLTEENLRNVPLAFKEGMASTIRASRLKDEPCDWKWSDAYGVAATTNGKKPSKTDNEIHALIALFSKVDDDEFSESVSQKLDEDWQTLTSSISLSAFSCIHQLPDAFVRKDFKGHFGYRDGISQPYIEGSGTSRRPQGKFADVHVVKAGEFILGHHNEFAQQVPALWVDIEQFPEAKVLRQYGLERNRRDFGRNGTYLVFRQLRQNVTKFESFLERASLSSTPGDITNREMIAAKLIGRWRSGAPLALCPEKDNKNQETNNDFMYDLEDRYGYKCPIGAHIRRSYPRDAIVEQGAPLDSETALMSSRRRRLLRRGRPYHAGGKDGTDVGLHFICLNADIREQFEFVQETWINNRRFGVTRDEVDPFVGSGTDLQERKFTIQKSPVSQSFILGDFVDVVGGGYFFLPSKRALSFLASLTVT